MLPQKPCSEQQSPKLDPAHVTPAPQVPSGLMVRGLGAGVPSLMPSRQYVAPTWSCEQLCTFGLAWMNWVTVMPAAVAMVAHVSPVFAWTLRVQAATA